MLVYVNSDFLKFLYSLANHFPFVCKLLQMHPCFEMMLFAVLLQVCLRNVYHVHKTN